MSKITLDDETLAKLGGVAERAELYDRAGKLVGYCTPADPFPDGIDVGGPDPFSDEQAAAAVRAGLSGRPTADVVRDLQKL